MPMPLVISGRNGHEVYAKVVDVALTRNLYESRSPRGQETRDLGLVTLHVTHPQEGMLPLGTRPGINTRIAAVEAAQLIGATVDDALMSRVAPTLDKYREPNGFFWGAYGNRIDNQVAHAVSKLIKDPDTRQGVITLWDPGYDNIANKKDYPCTVLLQFEIRTELLCMNTVMRSNDIWLGLPLDLFQFGQLQQSVARALNRDVGYYQHTALSMHAYTRDLEALEAVDLRNASKHFQPYGFGLEGQDWNQISNRAHDIIHNELINPTTSEFWYLTRFTS